MQDPFRNWQGKTNLTVGLGSIGRLVGNMLWQNLLFSRQFLPSYQQAVQKAMAIGSSDFTQAQIENFQRNQMQNYGALAQQMAARMRGQGGGNIETALMLNAQNQAMANTGAFAAQLMDPQMLAQRQLATAGLAQQVMGGDQMMGNMMNLWELAIKNRGQRRSGLGSVFGAILGGLAGNPGLFK
jgi:hypothetical protein